MVEKICSPFTPKGCTRQTIDDTWYYDANVKRCLYGTGYGNCAGNDNRFVSENECMKYCVPKNKSGTLQTTHDTYCLVLWLSVFGAMQRAQCKWHNGENNRTLILTLFLTLNLTLNDYFRHCAICIAPNTDSRRF